MTPGHHLSKQHSIEDYDSVSTENVAGFVYVETDRYLPSAEPAASDRAALQVWAAEALSEIAFLRRIAEGKPEPGDGFQTQVQADKMKGAVVYAPLHLSPAQFESYLELARQTAGETMWQRVVGFRYLLQGKREGEVEKLLQSEGWMENVLSLRDGREGMGWTFDFGVDTHRDGVEMVEYVGIFIQKVRKREEDGKGHVRFVLSKCFIFFFFSFPFFFLSFFLSLSLPLSICLWKFKKKKKKAHQAPQDHLCKPPLSVPPSSRYLDALKSLSHDENVFMKFSGALNEFSSSPDPATTPSSPSSFLDSATPFLDHVFTCFPARVMFGSDWPVCNVGGPKGEAGNWKFWVEIVEEYMNRKGMTETEKESVWWKAGAAAYRVQV